MTDPQPEPSAATVCAVVVTWRRPELAEQTVRSVLRQVPTPRVVVVDNAPELDSSGHLLELGGDVEVIGLPGNIGFSGGLAAGMRHAAERGEPDWYWLLDDDSPVGDGSLQRALELASDLPANAVLGNRGAVLKRGRIVKVQGRDLERVEQVPLTLVDGTLVSAGAVRQGGYPRTDMFIMFEDFEYSLRLGRAGVPIFLGPGVESQAMHVGSAGVQQPWRAYYQTRNHLRAAIESRSPVIIYSWIARFAKQIGHLVVRRPELWSVTARYRFRGARDAILNRLGKQIDPDLEPAHLSLTANER